MNLYKTFIKRLLDIIISLVLLLLLFPFIFMIAMLISMINLDNPFYTQNRPGKDAKKFKVFKFKTMNDNKDENGKLLSDEKRLTVIGKLIRAYSIDELPQLFNVLKGNMSLIGPRPLLMKYIPLYNSRQLRRHEVRPGITGWAQVNGRNNISWQKKFELDTWYVDNISFLLDCKIILLTIKKVLFKQDVSKDGFATTETFNGSN